MVLKIEKDISLSELTTFRLGGSAKCFTRVNNKSELKEAVSFAKEKNLPIFVLGGGSDILISDLGFPGLVIHYTEASVSFRQKEGYTLVTSSAGLNWDELVKKCVERNLQGIECLSGIPGSVGAAPIQNIGAYGQELKDTFVKLNAYDIEKEEFKEMQKGGCEFGYRESVFKRPENRGKYVICDITLKLKKNGKTKLQYESLINYLKQNGIESPSLGQIRQAVLSLRSQKLEDPKLVGNAGSFFKNPFVSKKTLDEIQDKFPDIPYYESDGGGIKLYAGWLIEKAGWKGKHYKNVAVSGKNALVILNPEGQGTAKEVSDLASKIINDVQKTFQIKLDPEVQYIGFKT